MGLVQCLGKVNNKLLVGKLMVLLVVALVINQVRHKKKMLDRVHKEILVVVINHKIPIIHRQIIIIIIIIIIFKIQYHYFYPHRNIYVVWDYFSILLYHHLMKQEK